MSLLSKFYSRGAVIKPAQPMRVCRMVIPNQFRNERQLLEFTEDLRFLIEDESYLASRVGTDMYTETSKRNCFFGFLSSWSDFSDMLAKPVNPAVTREIKMSLQGRWVKPTNDSRGIGRSIEYSYLPDDWCIEDHDLIKTLDLFSYEGNSVESIAAWVTDPYENDVLLAGAVHSRKYTIYSSDRSEEENIRYYSGLLDKLERNGLIDAETRTTQLGHYRECFNETEKSATG